MSRDALQSIPSGYLVVAAPRAPNALQANVTKQKAHPGVTLPSLQRSKNSSLPLEPATRTSATTRTSLRAKAPSSPRGDPAFRVEQEMKGRRPKRPPFNQIRLPLQARAGNRPTN